MVYRKLNNDSNRTNNWDSLRKYFRNLKEDVNIESYLSDKDTPKYAKKYILASGFNDEELRTLLKKSIDYDLKEYIVKDLLNASYEVVRILKDDMIDDSLRKLCVKNIKNYKIINVLLNDEIAGNMGMWEYYNLPNDDPADFNWVIHFNNIISEHKIPMDRCSLHFGISKISLEDYLKNYDFYNNINGPFLIIADECDIEKIDNIIKLLVHDLVNLNKDYFSKIAFLKALESSELNNLCTIICLNDNWEFKLITILHKDVD